MLHRVSLAEWVFIDMLFVFVVFLILLVTIQTGNMGMIVFIIMVTIPYRLVKKGMIVRG